MTSTFFCFENKIICVHSCAVSDCSPWGWIRLVLICWFAFGFGWVLSLFTRHQVWHSPELCELIQHTNLGVWGKEKIRCTTHCSNDLGRFFQKVSHCSQGKKPNCASGSEEERAEARCLVAVICWLPQWSWRTLPWRCYFVRQRLLNINLSVPYCSSLLLLPAWVTHLALQREREKIREVLSA